MNQIELFFEREKYRNNFKGFCRDILGYSDMNSIHSDLCSFLVKPKRYKLILMPRFTFKSCIVTIGTSLWRLARDYDMRILIYSDALAKAKGFLTSVTNHITGKIEGSKFRELYGHWEVDPKKDKWNQEQIVIAFRQNAQAEPSVDTGGQDSSKIGFHYDLIIFDDIVSDQNVTTKAQMDKTVDCYKKALSLLKPGGDIIIVGTRWNFGDLYGRLIAENDSGLFDVFIKKAKLENKYLFDNIGENSLTPQRLQLLKKQQGTATYSCLYLNDPVSGENAIFKAEDFSFFNAKGEDLYITATIDPAGEGEDMTAITVVGTDHEMNMYLLEIVAKVEITPSQMIEEIVRLNRKYKFKKFGIETNFFRGTLKLELEQRRMKEHTEDPQGFPSFGIEEFKASGKKGERKHQRILALQPYHERGAIKFPGTKLELLQDNYAELANQFLKYTIDGAKSQHDDIIDSLAYHLPLIRRGGVVKETDLPHNCPADIERKMYEQEIQYMAKRPRRARERVTGLAFS